MINRFYFMNAKVTDANGYCYSSTIGAYRSCIPDPAKVFDEFSNKIKKELFEIRPNGQFEVISFNRV